MSFDFSFSLLRGITNIYGQLIKINFIYGPTMMRASCCILSAISYYCTNKCYCELAISFNSRPIVWWVWNCVQSKCTTALINSFQYGYYVGNIFVRHVDRMGENKANSSHGDLVNIQSSTNFSSVVASTYVNVTFAGHGEHSRCCNNSPRTNNNIRWFGC